MIGGNLGELEEVFQTISNEAKKREVYVAVYHDRRGEYLGTSAFKSRPEKGYLFGTALREIRSFASHQVNGPLAEEDIEALEELKRFETCKEPDFVRKNANGKLEARIYKVDFRPNGQI